MIDLDNITIRDVDAVPDPTIVDELRPEWDRLMADPCPCCGAFRLTLGYLVHMGECDACADAEARALSSLR